MAVLTGGREPTLCNRQLSPCLGRRHSCCLQPGALPWGGSREFQASGAFQLRRASRGRSTLWPAEAQPRSGAPCPARRTSSPAAVTTGRTTGRPTTARTITGRITTTRRSTAPSTARSTLADFGVGWGWGLRAVGVSAVPGYYYGGAWASARLEVKPRDAQVFVDGYYVGVVDQFDGVFQRLDLPTGEHEVVVYLPGYRTYTAANALPARRGLSLQGDPRAAARRARRRTGAAALARQQPWRRSQGYARSARSATIRAIRAIRATRGIRAIRASPRDPRPDRADARASRRSPRTREPRLRHAEHPRAAGRRGRHHRRRAVGQSRRGQPADACSSPADRIAIEVRKDGFKPYTSTIPDPSGRDAVAEHQPAARRNDCRLFASGWRRQEELVTPRLRPARSTRRTSPPWRSDDGADDRQAQPAARRNARACA